MGRSCASPSYPRANIWPESPGRRLSRWPKLLLRDPKAFSKPQPTIDLDPIAANVYAGCMGLPQELVERIIYMLQDNRRALKACSLTCRAMFASARHLIHRTLHLTARHNQEMLTPTEKKRHARGSHSELGLQILPFMVERGLLKYAQHLKIDMQYDLYPQTLKPHLHLFPSLDRIHTLTIHSYGYPVWQGAYNLLFIHLCPTLTTLVLYSPLGHYHNPIELIPQFPNLQNLTLESLPHETWGPPRIPKLPAVSQPPPLRGHLRIARSSPGNPVWPREFPCRLPNGMNFRSVEFQDVHCAQGQQILDMCAGSLEKFTIRIDTKGEREVLATSFLSCDSCIRN